jgi:alkyl hydroperoxide reductase subunit AhpF
MLSCHPSSCWEIYFTILQKIVNSVNKKKLESKLEKWISKYDLKIEDFEKISKLVKIKVRRTAREDELSKMAKTELDKKYFIKFQKMFLI